MNISEYTNRIEKHQELLKNLLNATSIKYSDWLPHNHTHLRESVGVYHFYEVQGSHVISLYVGKAGFGVNENWSLFERLKQHFQPSQKYALLGKASIKLCITPQEAKKRLNSGNVHLQWLKLGERSNTQLIAIESELKWFECFAIAVLMPEYTDA